MSFFSLPRQWVSEVLESKDLAKDAELENARRFVKDLVFTPFPKPQIHKSNVEIDIPDDKQNSKETKSQGFLSRVKDFIS